MIAQITLSLHRTGLPYAAVLIDDSQSMTVVDHYTDKPSKAMAAAGCARAATPPNRAAGSSLQSLATEDDGRLAARHRRRPQAPHLLPHRPSRRPPSGRPRHRRGDFDRPRPRAKATRLGAGIRTTLDTLRGATPAAIVLLTDGVNTDGPSLADAAEYARRRGVPLYFVGFGSDRPVRDLKLFDLMVDDVVFVDDVVNFECKLSAAGFEGRKVSVVLREKDKPATPANVLAKTEVTIAVRRSPPASPPAISPDPSRPVRVRRRGRAATRRDPHRKQPPNPHRSGPQGENPRPSGPSLSELRVPLSPQHAPARRNDRAAHRSARSRPGTRRARRLVAASVSAAPRRAVRLRRRDSRRRESGPAQFRRPCKTSPISSTSRPRAARWC